MVEKQNREKLIRIALGIESPPGMRFCCGDFIAQSYNPRACLPSQPQDQVHRLGVSGSGHLGMARQAIRA